MRRGAFGNNNDNEPPDRDDEPRFVFITQEATNRPVLTEFGYRAFSTMTFMAWFAVVLIL